MVSQGIYEHYKSTPDKRRYYQVVFLSHYEETLEVMVHYMPLYYVKNSNIYDDGITIWTRTLKNFVESVDWDGKTVPRFKRIDSTIKK